MHKKIQKNFRKMYFYLSKHLSFASLSIILFLLLCSLNESFDHPEILYLKLIFMANKAQSFKTLKVLKVHDFSLKTNKF